MRSKRLQDCELSEDVAMIAMEVRHVSSTWVRPDRGLQGEIPLNIFDRACSYNHIPFLLVYTTPTACNAKIMSALARALSHYPKLAGKLFDHSPLVILNDDAGVPVYETTVLRNLTDILPLQPRRELTALCPHNQESNPLLMIQLNRFSCGGLVIGLSASHKVADGLSISSFLMSWSQLVLGEEVSPVSIHDQSLLTPRNPPMPQFPHQNVEFSWPDATETEKSSHQKEKSVENVYVHYTSDFLRGLKQQTGLERCSTFECLLSYLWKMVTMARRLDPEAVTRAKVAVNGRPRLGVPPEYFGNLVVDALPTAKVKDLLQNGLGWGVKLIKETVGQIDREYFQSLIDFGELNKDKQLCPLIGKEDDASSMDLVVSSWLGFQFRNAAVGGCSPCAFMVPWVPEEGTVIISAACSPAENIGTDDRWGSGVNVCLSLAPAHAEAFKQIAQ